MLRLALVFKVLLLSTLVLLSGCASYNGRNLKPGTATQSDVIASMGEPAMDWTNSDGSAQLAYPRGPAGTETFMVFIAPNGVLQEIKPVLNAAHFAQIKRDSTQQEVLRLIGPPQADRTVYFEARDELVWEWRFCDSFSQQAFFNVLFDGTSGLVRSSLERPAIEYWRQPVRFCGRS